MLDSLVDYALYNFCNFCSFCNSKLKLEIDIEIKIRAKRILGNPGNNPDAVVGNP